MHEVSLRNPDAGDIPLFFEYQKDPIAHRKVAFMSRDPYDEAAFTEHWTKILADDGVTKRAILVGRQTVGYVLSFIRDDVLEVGYWIDRKYWGCGIATAALRLFLQDMTDRPLFGRVVDDNVGSIRVLQKCGFTVCGHDEGFASTRGEVVEETIFRLD